MVLLVKKTCATITSPETRHFLKQKTCKKKEGKIGKFRKF